MAEVKAKTKQKHRTSVHEDHEDSCENVGEKSKIIHKQTNKKKITFKFDNVTCRTGRLEENFGIDRMQHVDPSVTGERLKTSIFTGISVLGQIASDVSFGNSEALTDAFPSFFKPQNTKIE